MKREEAALTFFSTRRKFRRKIFEGDAAWGSNRIPLSKTKRFPIGHLLMPAQRSVAVRSEPKPVKYSRTGVKVWRCSIFRTYDVKYAAEEETQTQLSTFFRQWKKVRPVINARALCWRPFEKKGFYVVGILWRVDNNQRSLSIPAFMNIIFNHSENKGKRNAQRIVLWFH